MAEPAPSGIVAPVQPATEPRPAYLSYEPGVPASIEYPETVLPAMLRAAGRLYPHRTATIFRGAKIDFRTLDRMADACAAGLQAAGVKPGDRVALVLPNIPHYPIALHGALRAGAVVVGCNPLYTAHELARQLADSGAETVIVMDRFLENVGKAIALAREYDPLYAMRSVFSADIAPYLPLAPRTIYQLLRLRDALRALPSTLRRGSAPHQAIRMIPLSLDELIKTCLGRPYHEVDRSPDDLAVLQYTGGTTGVSKGAMLTHRNLIANTLQVDSWSPELRHGTETVLCVAPFFHIYGLTVALNFAIYSGSTMVLIPRFDIRQIAGAVKRYRPTVWPGVPTMYVALADYVEKHGLDCGSLKVCISGASPLPAEVRQRFERLTGGSLVEGYGLSEASPVTHCNPVRGASVIGSIGLPYPDTEARLDANAIPSNDDINLGELMIRGPQVMRGYWNRPDETASVLQDGWLRTGDIARLDENGYYYIVDRLKDMIIAGGFNVYPREVDEVLYMHGRVREAVVVGAPDAYRGQTVKAYIVLRDDETGARSDVDERAVRAEIEQLCRARLAAYKVPKIIEFRADLPKTAVGKILRRTLRDEEPVGGPGGDS